ncbi:hypothetical protein [Yinghuangia seranimata]|uniref:hypothetical protein n=1 Tax=Yinghuangia seranimata TaxID=408067 RepID=UPI00248C91A6|nr:hypothetical protein [Yinghuangia seranimata]MDI2125975.1 hypothetical protein [Yinghuangia seranimata]
MSPYDEDRLPGHDRRRGELMALIDTDDADLDRAGGRRRAVVPLVATAAVLATAAVGVVVARPWASDGHNVSTAADQGVPRDRAKPGDPVPAADAKAALKSCLGAMKNGSGSGGVSGGEAFGSASAIPVPAKSGVPGPVPMKSGVPGPFGPGASPSPGVPKGASEPKPTATATVPGFSTGGEYPPGFPSSVTDRPTTLPAYDPKDPAALPGGPSPSGPGVAVASASVGPLSPGMSPGPFTVPPVPYGDPPVIKPVDPNTDYQPYFTAWRTNAKGGLEPFVLGRAAGQTGLLECTSFGGGQFVASAILVGADGRISGPIEVNMTAVPMELVDERPEVVNNRSALWGRVSADVARVDVTTPDGKVTRAVVRDGVWFADGDFPHPSKLDPAAGTTAIRAYDAGGTLLAERDNDEKICDTLIGVHVDPTCGPTTPWNH